MDAAINNFCKHVIDSGAVSLSECGIDKNKQFFFGNQVDSIDNQCLCDELTNYPDLKHLIHQRIVTKQEVKPYYNYQAAEKTLPGPVTLVTCKDGLLAWVGRKNGEKPYGIVSSVDQHMRLDRGIAQAIKNKFGGDDCQYHRESQQHQIQVGECITYDFISDVKPFDLDNCQTVHNVLVPVTSDRAFFEEKLKDAVLAFFNQAYRRGLSRIFCPLLGCGRASGSGAELAKAVLKARDDFELTGKRAPELILVGMSSSGTDKAACIAFENQCLQSGRQNPATGSPIPYTSTIHSAGASVSLSVTGTEIPLHGQVTLATCKDGLLTWAGRKNGEKAYGIVSSVDQYMQLDSGIAKAIKNKFAGTNYYRDSQQHQIAYGKCVTYRCTRADNPPDLTNCRTVHNVFVPFSSAPNFEAKLKNAFFEVFKEADLNGLNRIFCPLLGCGRAGGSGKKLAEAVFAAKVDFVSTGRQAPELILVGRSSEAGDITACNDFTSHWYASGQHTPSAGSPVRSVTTPASMSSSGAAATAINTTTSTVSGGNAPSVLIRDQLEIVMNSDKGMFGYARELSKQGIPFDLVNAANSQMNHSGGIARQFLNDLGAKFNQDTHDNTPIQTGRCYTTGPYGYASDPRYGLRHCQHIHNVVAPNKADYKFSVNSSGAGVKEYQQDFTNAFVSLLLEASKRGSNTIVSCFIGCAIFGGSGEDIARALYAAYQDAGIQRLLKVPKLILVGWDDKDKKVHDDFIQNFKSLNTANPVCLPSGRTPVGAEKAIDCDVCGESKPEKGSQQYQGLQVCSGCTDSYRKQGHDLSAKLAEEYAAINYQPLRVSYSNQDLPGYQGVGRIIVGIDATAPAQLSNGQMLDLTRKNETHYLPNNDVGNELRRLLEVLHEEKLIYKIDKSNTTGKFGITFNVHLKTSVNGEHGYPDRDYPMRVLSEIVGLASTHGLQDKLDTSKLVSLILADHK